MSKLSKRLEMVASFIDENDKSVIDIGCDHGLLSIYLAEKFNNLKIIASDVNNNALVTFIGKFFDSSNNKLLYKLNLHLKEL